jgi:hypothetical protein
VAQLTIPKTLRIFFKYRRRLLGELSRAAVQALTVYFEALAGEGCGFGLPHSPPVRPKIGRAGQKPSQISGS